MNLLNNIKPEQNALAGCRQKSWIDDLIIKFERKFQKLEVEIKDEISQIFQKKVPESHSGSTLNDKKACYGAISRGH